MLCANLLKKVNLSTFCSRIKLCLYDVVVVLVLAWHPVLCVLSLTCKVHFWSLHWYKWSTQCNFVGVCLNLLDLLGSGTNVFNLAVYPFQAGYGINWAKFVCLCAKSKSPFRLWELRKSALFKYCNCFLAALKRFPSRMAEIRPSNRE